MANQRIFRVVGPYSPTEAFFSRMLSRGINTPRTRRGVVIAGGAKAAWFKDSEGNILAIIQTL